MSLEEKENGIEQENNTPEPAGHTGEAGSENSAPVKRRPQNRRPVQRRTARPKNTSEEGRKAEGAESTVQKAHRRPQKRRNRTDGLPDAALRLPDRDRVPAEDRFRLL
mgnify:CR=1 FL=1